MNKKHLILIIMVLYTAFVTYAEYYSYNPSTGSLEVHSSLGPAPEPHQPSGGGSGGPNLDSEEIEECQNEAEELEQIIDDLLNEDSSDNKDNESEEKEILEEEYCDSDDLSNDESNEPPSTEGDPVFIITGQYTLKEKDIGFEWGINKLNILRNYISFDYPDGSYGKNWNCSLDARLVFGIPDENISKKQELQKRIDDCRKRISSFSSFVPNLVEKLNDAEKKCNLIKTDFIISGVNNEKTIYGKALKYSNCLKYNKIIHINENGGVETFVYNSEENCFRPEKYSIRNRVKIKYDDENRIFLIKYQNGKEKIFSMEGLPLSENDRYGLSIEYLYDNNSRIIGIKHNKKEIIHVKRYDDGKINEIINVLTGKQVRYLYSNNNLQSVIDVQNDKYLYEYNEDDNLAALIKPDGNKSEIKYTSIVKNGVQKQKVSLHIDEEGFAESYSYNQQTNTVVYEDADGRKTIYEIDGNHIVKLISNDNQTVTWEYDTNGFVRRKTDFFGTTEYDYDECGRCIKEEKNGNVRQWFYNNEYGKITKYIDEENNTNEFYYDEKGNCVRKYRNKKEDGCYEYESWGGIKKISRSADKNQYTYNSNYQTTSDKDFVYDYNSHYELNSKTDKMNNHYTYRFENNGKKIVTRDPFYVEITYILNKRKDIEQIIIQDLINRNFLITKFVYDKRHLIKEIYKGSGLTAELAERDLMLQKSCQYTNAGRVSKIVLWNYGKAKQNDAPGICTEYVYDFKNNSVQENKYFVDENCNRINELLSKRTVCFYEDNLKKVNVSTSQSNILYEYTDKDKLQSIKTPDGKTEEYFYDKAGRIVEIKNIYGGHRTISYSKSDGNISKIKYENDKEEVFSFNNDGLIQNISSNDGNRTIFTYNDLGNYKENLIEKNLGSEKEVYDCLGNLTEYVVKDKEGNNLIDNKISYKNYYRKAVIEENGIKYENTYDGFGRCIIYGKENTEYIYDSNNNIIMVKRKSGDKYIVTEIEYNALRKVSWIKTPSGKTMNFFYDAVGRLVKKTDEEGIIWEGKYYSDGNLKSEKGRLLPLKEYFYDESGNLKEIKEAGDEICRLNFAENNKIIITDAKGNDYTEWYDQSGRIIKTKDRLGNEKTIKYDNNYSLIKDFNGYSIQMYEYEYSGHRMTKYNHESTEEVNWNYLNQITSIKNDFSNEKFVYENGRLKKQTIDGRDYLYTYDSKGRKRTVRGPDINEYFTYNDDNTIKQSVCNDLSISYVYDIEGNEISSYSTDGNIINKEYDSIGRLISIEQKNSSGAFLFAEYYIYDENGRIACISDYEGNVSLFEYDSHGHLSKAVIPYYKEIEDQFRKEFTDTGDEIKDIVVYKTIELPKSYISKLKKIWSKNKLRLPKAQNGQLIWTENYEYDLNGNRIKKETPAGTINYYYDKENRLVKYGNQNYVTISYDKNGNMLLKDSVYRSINMAYNYKNRLTQIVSLNKKDNLSETYNYNYDALSRRIIKSKNGRQTMRTVYDGLTMNPLTEYRISGKSQNSISEGYISSVDTYFPEQRSFLYVNNILRGQTSASDTYVFCTDIRGSIRSANSLKKNRLDLISYDICGNPSVKSNNNPITVSKEADSFGIDRFYCSKSYDSSIELYDFGYRNYSPLNSIFTSTDPIIDGFNWYSYCANDPVNFYDPDGLKIKKINFHYKMQDERWGGDLVGKKSEPEYDKNKNVINNISNEGCALTLMADIVSTVLNEEITPKDLNNNKENFSTEEGKEDYLNMEKVGENYGLEFDYWTETYTNLGQKLLEIQADDSNQYIGALVKYNENDNTHWVGVESVVEIDGKLYIKVDGTSKNDKKEEWARNSDGALKTNEEGEYYKNVFRKRDTWIEKDGQLLIEISDLERIYTFDSTNVIEQEVNNCSK